MRLIRQGCHHGLFGGLPLLLAGIAMVSSPQAVIGANSVTLSINATFTEPTCTLDMPDRVYLGSIRYGTTRYRPFTLTVNCLSASNTEIYAQALGDLLRPSVTNIMRMNGPDNRAEFALEKSISQHIELNGDTNDTTSGFCAGTNSRTCTLTPKTYVPVGAEIGERSALIRFNIRYKA